MPDQAPSTNRRLGAFIVGVCALAVSVLWFLPRADLDREPEMLLLMLALAALTGHRPINLRSLRTTVSASDPFLFATIAALGGVPAVLVGLISILSSSIGAKIHIDAKKLIFNLAACVVAVSTASWTFEFFANGDTVLQQVLPLFLATTVYFLANTSLIAAAISIDRGKAFFSIWKGSTLWTAVTNYCGMTVAIGLLLVVDFAGPVGLVLGAPPVWLFVAYFRSHRDRLREQQARMEQVLESNQRLEDQVRARTKQLDAKVAELERAKAHLRNLANTDELTLLANRRHFQHYLSRELSRGKRFKHPVSVLLIDADHFKRINDDFGHPTGDLVLQQLATAIDHGVRSTDLAARYGGEEFAIVLAETPKAGALKVAKKLCRRIAETSFGPEGSPGPDRLTVSIGVAAYPEDAADSEELVSVADQRLYQAKEAGRDRAIA